MSIPVTIETSEEATEEPEEVAEETTEPEETVANEPVKKEKTGTPKKSSSKEGSTSKKKSSKSKVSEPKTVTRTSGQLSGPEAIIACGNYYSSVLEKAVKKGEKWVYSNNSKYVNAGGTFEDMLKGNMRGGNCASIANWAFRDMGITDNKSVFYGDSNGKIRNYNSGKKKLKKIFDDDCDIINLEKQNKSFGTLMKEGKIKVGDIIIGKGHTYIYRGSGTVFASGHDAKWHKDKSIKTDDSNRAVFESWIRNYKGTYDERFKVHFIIRVKDSFTPKYYRDEKGNLVKNR